MALGTVSNVLAGIPDASGGFWVKDLIEDPSAYPTEETDLATDGWTPVGFISEDGITESNERDVEKVKAWGGDTIRVLQNEHTQTFTLTFSEMRNIEVLQLIYGEDNVTESGNVISIKQNAKVLPHKSFAFEVLDGDTKVRKFIPDGQIVETGEMQITHSAVMSIEVTIEAFVDSNGDKVLTHYIKVDGAAGVEDPGPDLP